MPQVERMPKQGRIRAPLTQCEHRHFLAIIQLDLWLLFVRCAPAHALQHSQRRAGPPGPWAFIRCLDWIKGTRSKEHPPVKTVLHWKCIHEGCITVQTCHRPPSCWLSLSVTRQARVRSKLSSMGY